MMHPALRQLAELLARKALEELRVRRAQSHAEPRPAPAPKLPADRPAA